MIMGDPGVQDSLFCRTPIIGHAKTPTLNCAQNEEVVRRYNPVTMYYK